MKTITVLVPTYNEEGNILNVYKRTSAVFKEKLQNYNLRLMFVDNASQDNTQSLIKDLCIKDKKVCAIFNVKNFGYARSQFNGLQQSDGDAIILMNADLQDPPEVIPEFVKEWEKGAKVVAGIKSKSKENPFIYFVRKIYYKLIKKIANIDHIDQFDGFGLYDKSFIDILKKIDDNMPYFRGIVAEYGANRKEIQYKQDVRKAGKSSFNFLSLYDFAMLGITSYSKVLMHLCTIFGAIISFVSFICAIWTFIGKIFKWNLYPVGSAAILIGVFFLGSLQLFFIGFVGEYIVNINIRTMHHPIVIEAERINFKNP